MTTTHAWRLIAERLADPTYAFSEGLCDECRRLWVRTPTLTARQWLSMQTQVRGHLPRGGFAYPPGTAREARVLAALWMALEAEEDPLYA